MTDPTNTITTSQQAQVLAHAMLRLAPNPSPQVWQTISKPVLSALLYTASPAGRGGGIAWIDSAVNALAAESGNAAVAVGICAGAPAGALGVLDDLDSAERTSVVNTIKAAVTPWIPVLA